MIDPRSGMPPPAMASPSFLVERIPLDGIERLFCRTYDATGDAVGASILALDGVPDEATLRAAVRDLQVRHPRLRAVVAADAGTLLWHVHDPADPPPIRVDFLDVAGEAPRWQDVVHQGLQEGLDLRQGPGIRVGVLRDAPRRHSRLYIIGHHAISSGNLITLHDLLHFYAARAASSGPRPAIAALPFLSLGRNCVAKSPWDLTRCDVLRERWRRHRREVLARRVRYPLAMGRRDAPAWEAHRFTPAETAAMMRACRRRKVSAVGMLLAAGLATQRRVLGARSMVALLGCPLDVRHHFEGPEGAITVRDLGNFVTRMVRPYRIAERSDFWRLAGRIAADARRALDRGLPRDAYAPVRAPRAGRASGTPVPEAAEDMARRRPHLDVHQAGVAPLQPDYADLRVRSCVQVARRLHSPSGFLLRIGAITLQNQLQVYLDPVEFLDPDFVATFHRELVSALRGIADAG